MIKLLTALTFPISLETFENMKVLHSNSKVAHVCFTRIAMETDWEPLQSVIHMNLTCEKYYSMWQRTCVTGCVSAPGYVTSLDISKPAQCLDCKPVSGRKWVYWYYHNILSTSYPVISDSDGDNFLCWCFTCLPLFIRLCISSGLKVVDPRIIYNAKSGLPVFRGWK